MIEYGNVDNIITAGFGSIVNWADRYKAHYKKYTNISSAIILNIVNETIHNLNKSGMKFYGVAKCSPEDTFNEKTGKRLAKKRLLAKYNRVLSMLDEELLKVLQNDIEFISRA